MTASYLYNIWVNHERAILMGSVLASSLSSANFFFLFSNSSLFRSALCCASSAFAITCFFLAATICSASAKSVDEAEGACVSAADPAAGKAGDGGAGHGSGEEEGRPLTEFRG